MAYGHLGGPFGPCEWLVSQYVQLQLKNVATRGPKDDLVSQSDFVGQNGMEWNGMEDNQFYKVVRLTELHFTRTFHIWAIPCQTS